jgi:hypothetical protein
MVPKENKGKQLGGIPLMLYFIVAKYQKKLLKKR